MYQENTKWKASKMEEEPVYREIIEFKETVSDIQLQQLAQICQAAHSNRGGHVPLQTESKYCFYFEGGEPEYGCLTLGYLTLNEIDMFRENVRSWRWEDPEPGESGDILKELSEPIWVPSGR